ncbi:calcium-binding protein [Ruixingdingia sedimenti]|uniref:Calcium-binding protein n=1 Tax=Ruixingdingia sedimenti TaxID=3073604 RepID=A0ABU1F2F8_9RHOB|nr:calcium-binding protein [Xinfangfangia sp. LG-4]MDR5651052.1 calcium-binding protein [Xinfangfangia sp. LG-4]
MLVSDYNPYFLLNHDSGMLEFVLSHTLEPGYHGEYYGDLWFSLGEHAFSASTYDWFGNPIIEVSGTFEITPDRIYTGNYYITDWNASYGSPILNFDFRLIAFETQADYGGSSVADIVFGSEWSDLVSTGAGNDHVEGREGADTLDGGLGDDVLYGGADADMIFGGHGFDLLRGEAGNDTLRGGGLRDLLYGGSHADLLQGDGGNDALFGGGGADTLYGGAGNDRLVGGLGKDVLYGGAGVDLFVFRLAAEAGAGGGRDVIGDFEAGIDQIDLSAMQAGLSFIGTAGFTGVAGQVRFNTAQGLVMGDLNGDGAADFAIEVTGVTGLLASDFVL